MNTLFSRIDLANRWGVTPNVIWNWSKRDKDFPKPVAVIQQGRVHVYALADVLNYEQMKGLKKHGQTT